MSLLGVRAPAGCGVCHGSGGHGRGRLGSDLWAHFFASLASAVTSSGRPSLTFPCELAANPAHLSPLALLGLFFVALPTAEMLHVRVLSNRSAPLAPMSVDCRLSDRYSARRGLGLLPHLV